MRTLPTPSRPQHPHHLPVHQVHLLRLRLGRQAGHADDVAEQRHEVAGAGGEDDLADGDLEVLRAAEQGRVVGEGLLGLGDAQGQALVAEPADHAEVALRLPAPRHVPGAVHGAGDLAHLHLDGLGPLVERAEAAELLLGVLDDLLGQLDAAVAAPREDLGHGERRPEALGGLAHHLDLLLGVGREAVERHHRRLAEGADALDVLLEVADPRLDGRRAGDLELGAVGAAVQLERPHGGHEHHGHGVEAGRLALDVEELLGPQVEAEAGLGHHPVGVGERHLGGDDGVAAVGDVGEGTAVHEGGHALDGLHEVGLEGVLEDHHHGAHRLQIGGGHRLLGRR